MPNWCENKIVIKGPADTIRPLWKKATSSYCGLLGAMVPEPPDLFANTDHESGSAPDWHNWHCKNWGCKWEVDTDGLNLKENTDGTVEIYGTFGSAWNAPLVAYAKFSDLNKDISIDALFVEVGSDFGGTWNNLSGLEIIDNLYDAWVEYEDNPDNATDLFHRLAGEFKISEFYSA